MLIATTLAYALCVPSQDALASEPAVEARQSPEPTSLYGSWLRHDSVVVDVDWYGPERLVTLDSQGTARLWDRDGRTLERRVELEGAVELETVASLEGEPLGIVVAYGGESPRIEFLEALDGEPAWTAEGLRGPIGVDPFGRQVIANGGGRVQLVECKTGSIREVFEIGDWVVADAHFNGDTLAILTINRAKQLGRGGTENEAAASLAIVGALTGDLRVLESFDQTPTRVARLGERWVAFGADARVWVLQAAGGVSEPAKLVAGSLLCADDGGELLVAVGADGVLRRSSGVGEAIEEGAFVGVGARRIVRARGQDLYAVADGTVVRVVDATGTDQGGAAGPAAQVSALDFHPGGNHLFVASYDHTARVVNLDEARDVGREASVGIVHGGAFSPVGGVEMGYAWVARGGRVERRVERWPGNPREAVQSAGEAGLPWTDLAANDGGVFAGLADGRLMAFEAATLEPRWAAAGLRGSRLVLAATEDALVVGGSGIFHVAPADGALQGELLDLGAPVESLALVGARGALGLASGGVATFDLDGPTLVATVADHLGRVQALALTEDGLRMASIGTNDRELLVTELSPAGERVSSTALPWDGPPCTALSWSVLRPTSEGATAGGPSPPAFRILAAGRLDGAILLYRFED